MIDRINWYLLNFVKVDDDTFLSHFMDTSTDTVYVAEDLNSPILLTYTANCDILDSTGSLVARSRLTPDSHWEFEDKEGNVLTTNKKDLIKAESVFTAKWFNREH